LAIANSLLFIVDWEDEGVLILPIHEDNEHLVEVLLELSIEDPAFKDNVYQALLARYPA